MYAVIETGGKQYRVNPGDVIDVELLSEPAERVSFDRVLMIGGDDGVKLGSPLLEGARVTGQLVEPIRDKKILVFKMKRRKGYKRLRGHRQDLHRVRIDKIEA